MPLRANRQQATQAVFITQFFVLIAGCIAQFVRQRWVQWYVIKQTDVLPRRRQLGLYAVAVALRVDPMAGEVETYPWPDIRRVAQTKPERARLSRGQLHRNGNTLLIGVSRVGIDPDAFEVAAGLHRLVEFGNQFRVIRRAGIEWHHALQQVRIKRRISFKTHIPEQVAWPAVKHQFYVGGIGVGVDRQPLTLEAAIKKPIARCLIENSLFDRFVLPVIEHGAWLQGVARHPKRLQFGSGPVDLQCDVAQTNWLAGLDSQRQPRSFASGDPGFDNSVVIAQRLQRFVRLLLGNATVTQQFLFAAITQLADVVLDVFTQRTV